MNERFYCLDCGSLAPLTKHGRCATCGSGAVAFGEAQKPHTVTGEQRDVAELERILSL